MAMPAKLVILCYNFYAFFFLKSEICYLHSNCKSSLIFNEKKNKTLDVSTRCHYL